MTWGRLYEEFQKPFFLKREGTTGPVSGQARAILSGIGNYRAIHRPEVLGFWAVWVACASAGQKGGIGSRAEPDGRGCRFGSRPLREGRLTGAGRRGGARIGKPRGVRIWAITVGSRRAAMIVKVPAQFGQCSRSIVKTRLSSLAQLMWAKGDEWGESA